MTPNKILLRIAEEEFILSKAKQTLSREVTEELRALHAQQAAMEEITTAQERI